VAVPRYPHLIITAAPDNVRFTSTRSGRDNLTNPPRNRGTHAGHLIQSVQNARAQQPAPRQIGNGFYQSTDLVLTFESEPGFKLAFESMEMSRSGIDLLAVSKDAERRQLARVRIPENKLQIFLRKLEAYRDNDPNAPLTELEKPKRDNRRLAESISQIRRATLRQYWTDEATTYPAPGQLITWEVWLRRAREGEPAPQEVLAAAQVDFGYEVISEPLKFVDRTVVLVRATPEQLALGTDFLGVIAELRKAKVTAGFFAGLPAADQHNWIEDLVGRTTGAANGAPFVGLLDTGVNRAHPLLAPIITDADLHSYKPQWGVNDSGAHGTAMAGLALFGDLTPLLEGDQDVELGHRLQSVKLVHDPDPHRPELYGAVTQEAVARLEVAPAGKPVYCMAITADGSDHGRPSSWSSAVDAIAMGEDTNSTRLVILAAGNTAFQNRTNYPADNETASVQDPAQAWNALTVGAFTEMTTFDQAKYPGRESLAAAGDLGPSSTTSLVWPHTSRWPFKPDIVMEGGNMARPGPGLAPDYIDDLSLLSTSHQFTLGQRPLTTMHDTSAAAALASRLAASLLARYPAFTPETVRGLMVHSARWTRAMLARANGSQGNLLRTFGYGTPDVTELHTSANNVLTLIAQSTLQPFFKDGDKGIKTNTMNIHALPWPREALQALPVNTQVKLRVTLSYFVEPSPGERGWDKKYGYASHGLRFHVQRPTETVAAFQRRINKFGREGEPDTHHSDRGWLLGTSTPTNGSIHSNVWTGTAAELANRSHIAVHPTMGWWKSRPGENRYERSVRYSLIVTIETPDVNIDIYTPVSMLINTNIPIVEINI
jgi:hypothetical protein